MHVGFVGLGLIGGSIARAVRAYGTSPPWTMSAWSPSGQGPEHAVADGTIDHASGTPEGALADADLVVLAGPPTACLAALDYLAGRWHAWLAPSAVITDVASTKAALLERADAAGLRYVGGHPMAGLEASGYSAGRADLFVDRPWVIVPGRIAEPADIERVKALVETCRARVLQLDAAAHDRAVAGISHLPLLLAAALVEAVAGPIPDMPHDDWPVASALAASGWRDMTRLARGDPAMGAGIAVTNAAALAERLRDLQAMLDAWRSELERSGGPDEAAISARLRAARARLEDPS
ncbi:MAG: prephenate dehydrogenase/arogenate dehydrogenase family protein [Candidatus Limnocylindrales bacterium]|nr:prephenate dehydrogenase/arogenate dehydrogenase family protein [Candidatus Limnocylindrales bacterium]